MTGEALCKYQLHIDRLGGQYMDVELTIVLWSPCSHLEPLQSQARRDASSA